MNEQYYERLLNIKTSGEQKNFNNSFHYNRYEPTSYSALEKLLDHYEIKNTDSLIDFGCGKGRLNFYINYFCDSKVTGIEMNNYFFEEALDNKTNYINKYKKVTDKINFSCYFAEEYEIKNEDNKFYFFNPFSIQIFTKVIDNILISVEKYYRPVDIILYYPSEEYIYHLENYTAFNLLTEIKIPYASIYDPREKFVIYRLDYML